MAAGLADRFSRLMMGELEFLDQPLNRLCRLDRCQVLALDVFDQRSGAGLLEAEFVAGEMS
jgi:hypothetical protein